MEKKIIELQKIKHGTIKTITDEVAIEQKLNIKIRGDEEFLMSCTPAYLEELIIGHLFTMGKIQDVSQVQMIDISLENESAIVKLNLDGNVTRAAEEGDVVQVLDLEQIFSLAETLYNRPGSLFVETGCAHSCALVQDGKVLCQIEDIGRHNALDKVIGYALKNQIDFGKCMIFSSGRISGDYLQKVLPTGIKIVISRAAVTSEAVSLAKKRGITLLGFVRKFSGNIYHIEKNSQLQ